MKLGEILSDRDFGLQMRFAKRGVADFFKPGEFHASVIAERRKWIASAPLVHVALLPQGVSLLDEALELASSLDTLPEGHTAAAFAGLEPLDRCRHLGGLWEADFLLMKPDHEGVFRLYGGCLCFPSHWDLREKVGLPMVEIHAPVPGLNETLGPQIDAVLKSVQSVQSMVPIFPSSNPGVWRLPRIPPSARAWPSRVRGRAA